MRSNEFTFTELARRQQIVAAAIELIAVRGYGHASVAKIADQVGIAKSVVMYHFKTKDDIIAAVVETVFTEAALVIAPAVAAQSAAAAKLSAYIRANATFIADHRTAAIAMLEIVTSYRSEDGLRLDQAAAKSVQEHPPAGDAALLDPLTILTEGVRSREFRKLSAVFVKNALRAALDGAVWEVARDRDYDVLAYGEELVTIFELATRPQP